MGAVTTRRELQETIEVPLGKLLLRYAGLGPSLALLCKWQLAGNVLINQLQLG